MCEVARRYDLDPGQLFSWRKKFGFGADRHAGDVGSADFVAVEINESADPAGSDCEESAETFPRFEIAFPNGRHLFVPADTPLEVLSTMIAAVEAS